MKMKKTMILALTLFLASTGSAFAHGTQAAVESVPAAVKSVPKDTISVSVNGVEVKSQANHQNTDGNVYVSVSSFADLFDKSFELSADQKTVQFNGKTINVQIKDGEPTAWVRELAAAVGAQSVSWDQISKEVYVLALPEGTIQLEPGVVPAMGEHWANPAAGELPNGPIYGVYNGKLVFLEYMIDQKSFVKGESYVNLLGMKGVPSPEVVQTDIELVPNGHPGFEIPHYDIHMYFITDEEQQSIK